jgi:hypothetical protein
MVMDLIIYMDDLLYDLYYIPLFMASGMTYKFIISVKRGCYIMCTASQPTLCVSIPLMES